MIPHSISAKAAIRCDRNLNIGLSAPVSMLSVGLRKRIPRDASSCLCGRTSHAPAVARKNSVQPVAGVGVRSLTVMSFLGDWLKSFWHLIRTACHVLLDFLRLLTLTCRSRTAVEAENLFLRKQLALFQERQTKARRADDSTRWLLGGRVSVY